MVKRYSGNVTVNVTWDKENNRYDTRVSAPGVSPLKLNVEASTALESAIRSSEAYDKAARASIILTEIELKKTEMTNLAAYRLERLHIGRSLKRKNPEPMSTKELNKMSKDDLLKIWSYIHQHPVKAAREFFPEQPQNYVSATKTYGAYASNRAAMLSHKEHDDQKGVAMYKFICERLKDTLPLWAD